MSERRQQEVGIGSPHSALAVYIGNRPPLPEFESLEILIPLYEGCVANIVEQTGNHWRKIFNVYAKLGFALSQRNDQGLALSDGGQTSWQGYRDQMLLRDKSGLSLLFSQPDFSISELTIAKQVHIISGKKHADTLNVAALPDLMEVGEDFVVSRACKVIVTPYFDYRQLSNKKLDKLVEIVCSLM